MKRLLAATAAFALLPALPILAAESTNKEPSTQSSGPGVKGMPGNKNGPAAKQPDNSSNTTTNPASSSSPPQDATGVKGAPGNKSGPAAKKPDNSGK